MYVLLVQYRQPLERIDPLIPAHNAYLDKYYARGTFIVSGRRIPRTGGIILADVASGDEMQRIIAEDPFVVAGVAQYDTIAFTPTKYVPRFAPIVANATSFPVGYYQLHPEVSINYQMNRFSTGTADMVAEMREVAPRIHGYADYIREFLALSEQALARGERLKGALYLRSAEFFIPADDARKQTARRRFIDLMRQEYGVAESDHHRVPYGTAALSAYRFTPAHPKGTIVLFGGFDSYIEELFATQMYLRDAGYEIITFEGPGQGTTLEDEHLALTPDWDKPVRAVLDYFRLDAVTLMGYSLGGGLALRAAAHEPRVRRVISDDILTDFFEVALSKTDAPTRVLLAQAIQAGQSAQVNAALEHAMKESLLVEWGVKQGMHMTGTQTPYDFLVVAQQLRTDDVSPHVQQDVLLMAGAEDHLVPLHQFADQIHTLTNARSLTARLFTSAEQAQNHVHVGNTGLALRVITDWIDSVQDEA